MTYYAPVPDEEVLEWLDEVIGPHIVEAPGCVIFAADLWDRLHAALWADLYPVDPVDDAPKQRQFYRLLRREEFLGEPARTPPLHWKGYRLATPREVWSVLYAEDPHLIDEAVASGTFSPGEAAARYAEQGRFRAA